MGIKISEADRWFSMAVRVEAGFECEHCGAYGQIPRAAPAVFQPQEGAKLECAHLYGRRNAALRWDMMNAASLCHHCHRVFTEEPRTFHTWVEMEFPGRWEILDEKMKRLDIKNNAATRAEVSKHYRDELRRIESLERLSIASWI